MVEKLIIIGSGPAGLSAALYASRARINPLIIAGKEPGGQLTKTTYVYNWPGEAKITGPDLIKKIRDQIKNMGVRFIEQDITEVNFEAQPFLLKTDKDYIYQACSVIICTGSTPKKTGVPGEQNYWAKGVSTCSVCDGPLFKDRKVLIVGGGNRGVQNALFMSNYTKSIMLIQSGEELTAEMFYQEELFKHKHIKVLYRTILTKISGNDQQVTQATIKNLDTKEEEIIDVSGIFISIGTEPNTKIFSNYLKLDSQGYIKLKRGTETTISGIFAAGDVIDKNYKQAITSAGMGAMAALDSARYLKSIDCSVCKALCK